MAFEPKFKISNEIEQALFKIESSKDLVSKLPINLKLLESLRRSARLTTTHYSTQIEGNRLTEKQVGEVLKGQSFPNRARDQAEVKNYFLALDYVDGLMASSRFTLTEDHVSCIHGLVMFGKEKPTPYREGQNVIKDSNTGSIVYMPPEADDIAVLMEDLITWLNLECGKRELPVPVIAGIAHYQYATIHPYYDGNGRTARLLTNLILHKSGYGLKGIYSLEEYYAQNLQFYYDALTIGDSHNYYFGRAVADMSPWVVYFCEGMAMAFANVTAHANEMIAQGGLKKDQSNLLRELDRRQKQVLPLFVEDRFVTTKEISYILAIHPRTALNLCHQWVEEDFLIQLGESNKKRKYELAEKWLSLVL